MDGTRSDAGPAVGLVPARESALDLWLRQSLESAFAVADDVPEHLLQLCRRFGDPQG